MLLSCFECTKDFTLEPQCGTGTPTHVHDADTIVHSDAGFLFAGALLGGWGKIAEHALTMRVDKQ